MPRVFSLPPPSLTLVLGAFCLLQLVGFAYICFYFQTRGYLPPPFVNDKSDTFMDFYHTLYWAGNEGRYAIWKSVYPPLNFLFLKLVRFLFLTEETFTNGLSIRSAYPHIHFFIAAMAGVSAFLAFWLGPLRQLSWRNMSLLFVFFVLSPPFLFAVERGNLIVMALPVLALVLTRGGWTRVICLAVLINLKPYFVILTLLYIAKRRYDLFILTGLQAAFVFLVTGLFLDTNFLLFFSNLFDFSQSKKVFSVWEVIAMPSSISAFAYVADMSIKARSALRILGFNLLYPSSLLSYVNLIVISCSLSAVVFFGKNLSPQKLLCFLFLSASNLGVWVGGYSVIFMVLFIPLFLRMRFNRLYLVIFFAIFSPLDIFIVSSDTLMLQSVFLSGINTVVFVDLGAGSLLRPSLNFSLLCLMVRELLFYPDLYV